MQAGQGLAAQRMEFDRQRNRIVRQTLAREEGQKLHEDDLDREFPALAPVEHLRESFKYLPAIPAWHEPLIFLLESRKADTSTILRWLFPTLHAKAYWTVTSEKSDAKSQLASTAMLSIEVVKFAVKVASDHEILIPFATRQSWWRALWGEYLYIATHSTEVNVEEWWPIAPLLLEQKSLRREVLCALASEQPIQPKAPLSLFRCEMINSEVVQELANLNGLEILDLGGCAGLTIFPKVAGFHKLRFLDLSHCTGFKGASALEGLGTLKCLERLNLGGCTQLTSLPELSSLRKLESLNLAYCTSLKKADSIHGLSGLENLKTLDFKGCTGLEELPNLQQLRQLQKLSLSGCTGLRSAAAIQALSGLKNLRKLALNDCTGLQELPELNLLNLEWLDLGGCTGLTRACNFLPLAGLTKLNTLSLFGRERIEARILQAVREIVPSTCMIIAYGA